MKPTSEQAADTRGATEPLVGHEQDITWYDAMAGEQVAIRVQGSQVNDRYSVVESVVGPGGAAPMHTHLEDEIFYILDGVATFALGDQILEAKKGAVVTIPAGTAHSWKNRTSSDVHVLALFAAAASK